MRIVHLSDAHFKVKRLNAFKNNIVTPLIRDILDFHKERPIDLICFTGDLIDKGGFGNAYETLEKFQEIFIDKILQELNLSRERFAMIPGNHDVERNEVHKFIEKQLQDHLVSTSIISKDMTEPKNLNLERIKAYKDFQDEYYKNVEGYDPNEYGYALDININSKKIAIAGSNSSWRCSDKNDRGRLIVGLDQVENILERFKAKDYQLKVALMHHPYDHLLESDKDDIESVVTRDFDILLTGHVHRSGSHSYQNSLGHGTIRSTASSNWDDNTTNDSITHCNGYTIIDINFLEGETVFHNRRYSSSKLKYIVNVDISESENGTSIFKLPSDEAREKYKKQAGVIARIKSNHLPTINGNLLVYNTDTVAPKELDSIFVLPQISVKRLNNESGDEENELLDLDNLCQTEEHLLLLGDRESGKSTLLYKLMKHLIKNSHNQNTVPIYLDLNKAKLISVEYELACYLGVRKEDLSDLVGNNRFLLLLDNLTFNRKQEKFIRKLIKFLEEYSNVTVIATAENHGDGEIPLEFLSQPFIKICRTANIRPFQSSQIKQLMRKWFGLSGNEKLSKRFERIVESFHSLNIPTTPLAVSMFLWIVEKQEEYIPKNNATMLNNFIEKILEKHDKTIIMSEDFDYPNQTSLLAHIAKKMYEECDTNYRLSTFELKNIIRTHFKEVGWTPKPIQKKPYYEWIPQYFLSVGLFIEDVDEEDTYAKFRLNCFFQFFLMHNIDSDDNFRELVFGKDNYLEFLSEIDYYTAIYRNKTNSLKRIVTLMGEMFQSIEPSRDLIKKLEGRSHDEFFRNQQPSFVNKFKTHKDIDEYVNVVKRSEDDDDEYNDLMLEDGNQTTHQTQINRKDSQSNYPKMKLLERSWVLAARVLKNSEESKDFEFKKIAFESVLKHSLVFMCLYNIQLNQFIKEINKKKLNQYDISDSKVVEESLRFMLKFLPPVHQMALFNNIGTSKLEPFIKLHLDSIINKPDVSLMEKFTSLFLYTDLHPDDEENYLKKMIPSMVNNSVKDFVFMKLSQYESSNQHSDSFYPELMKKFLYMGDSKLYNPSRQRNQEKTKSRMETKRLFQNTVKT